MYEKCAIKRAHGKYHFHIVFTFSSTGAGPGLNMHLDLPSYCHAWGPTTINYFIGLIPTDM